MSTNNSTNPEKLPAHECIPWIVLLITESVAITILNIITIIVFLTQRQLQRRGIYLLIRNLAIVDLLVGAISGPLQIERLVGENCDVWEYDTSFTWGFLVKFALLHLFSFASFTNLVAISLERVHATFCPSRHFLMNKRVYYVTIAAIWLIAIIREAIQTVVFKMADEDFDKRRILDPTIYVAYYLICLLFICLSYVSIFVKIRFSPHINPLGSVIIRERQLTATLFAVTVASVLNLLPVILYLSVFTFRPETLNDFSLSSFFHTTMTVLIFFLGNSLANPIIYSMRMQGFRAGLENLFCKTPSHVNAVALPLTPLNK